MLDRAALRRILQDKLRADSAAADALPATPWPDDFPVGADSLERMALAGAINEMFHLHETGIEDLLLARRSFGGWLDIVSQAWLSHPQHITFSTSGSTGVPKPCPHGMANLAAEAAEHAARLRPGRILSAVPSHHIYGFIFGILLPLHAVCPVLDLRRTLPAGGAFRPDDVIVSFPDHLRFLARTFSRLPAVTAVTATAAMPEALARDMRARGLARLVEIYGASETGGIGWRDDPGAPFTLLDRWSAATPEPDGTWRLTLADGSAAVTPDEIRQQGARGFTLLRRRDGAVQIGGINVFPERVAAVLATHPRVREARVRLGQGGRLKALVVPGDDGAGLADELRAWSNANLTVSERPLALTMARAVPTGAMGKDADWEA